MELIKSHLIFRRDVKTTREYVLYSSLSMIAEVGGYVGLLLGISLFKLADVMNALIERYTHVQINID